MSRTVLFVRLAFGAVVMLLGSFLLLPLHGADNIEQGKAYALLIGVKTFDHGRDYELGALDFTENDVEELAKLLDRPGSSFHGLRPDGKTKRVRVLTSTRGRKTDGDKPTAANIRHELQELTSKRTSDEMVLVALASHGIELIVRPPDAKGRGILARPEGESSPDDRIYPFFCPSDAKLDGTDYATGKNQHLINLHELITATLGECKAGTKLLLVDICRQHKRVRGARTLSVDYKIIPQGLGAMFSCKTGQQAGEDSRLKHGIFFYFFLQGLRGEAKDPTSGRVTWKTLDHYVGETMESESKRYTQDRLQTPHSFCNFVGSDPVLARLDRAPLTKSNLPPRKGDLRPSRPGTQIAAQGIQNSIGMLFMPIPKGTFLMGMPAGTIRNKDEKQHEVEITADFFMGTYEVTQEQYHTVMGHNPNAFSEGGQKEFAVRYQDTRNYPVEGVSWNDADQFCKKLSALPRERAAGRMYRLPTEAEWEYACREGIRQTRPFYFGSTMSVGQANFDCQSPFGGAEPHNSLNHPCPVGNFDHNLFGLYDMHGNVREWCSDWYDKDYYQKSPKLDPQGPTRGSYRVVRGGSWKQDGKYCRSTHRDKLAPEKFDDHTGVRVVCVIQR